MVLAMTAAFLAAKYVNIRHTRYETAKLVTGGDAARSPAIFRRYGCSGCHTIPGVPGADGLVGPQLSNLSKRVYIAGVLSNTSDNLEHWIVSPEKYSPRTAMPTTGITPAEARDLAAYLYSN
jgi:cytochrome c2